MNDIELINEEISYRLSPKIIRAWFDTVLNPLYDGLLYVKNCLNLNDYTWDYSYQDFIDIKPVRSIFDSRAYPNYEHLILSEFPELSNLSIDYDTKREDFNISCRNLFNSLINSEDLNLLINRLLTEHENNRTIDSAKAEYMRGISIKWIAGYLINNKTQLSEQNIFNVIWVNNYEKFFDILELDNIRELKNILELSRIKFEQSVDKILTEIKIKRFKMSSNYGEPIVI